MSEKNIENRVKRYLTNLHNFQPYEYTVPSYIIGIFSRYLANNKCGLLDLLWGEYVTRMVGPRNDEKEEFPEQDQQAIDKLRKINKDFQEAIRDEVSDEELVGVMVMSPIIWGRYKRDPNKDAIKAYQMLEAVACAMYWAFDRGMGQLIQKYYLPRFQEACNALFVNKDFLKKIEPILRVQNRLNQTENRDGQMYESFRNRAIRMLCGDPSCDQYIEQGKIENKRLKKVFSKAQKLVKMDEEGEGWKKGKQGE